MKMNRKNTDLNESLLDSRMSDKQAESTIEESFHEEKTETNESETKTKPSLLDSIVQSCKAYINNLLTNLRHDNRSLVTGLAVVSAISCFLTASFAYFTQNHPTSQNTYLYDQSPSNTADFYYQYSIEPYGNYPQPFILNQTVIQPLFKTSLMNYLADHLIIFINLLTNQIFQIVICKNFN